MQIDKLIAIGLAQLLLFSIFYPLYHFFYPALETSQTPSTVSSTEIVTETVFITRPARLYSPATFSTWIPVYRRTLTSPSTEPTPSSAETPYFQPSPRPSIRPPTTYINWNLIHPWNQREEFAEEQFPETWS